MNRLSHAELKRFLDEKASFYNRPDFIQDDPISIPHLFSLKEDIEIAGFLTATISWGQRKTILRNARRLLELMDDAPFQFITSHTLKDRKRFAHFVHRTFQPADCSFFLESLQFLYNHKGGLEFVLTSSLNKDLKDLGEAIDCLRHDFFALSHKERTEKHFPSPRQGSATKRMNMFLRWMVRKDQCGVDFGIWTKIPPTMLICPLDVHSSRVARKLGLLRRSQNDWKAAQELTVSLRKLDPDDPVKYDFALFGLGVSEKF